MHQSNDSARQPRPIRGWLLVLCALLLVWEPISSALSVANGLAVLSVRGTSLAIVLLARTVVAALGVAAGIALAMRRSPAVSMAKTALMLSAALDVFIYTTHYVPNNRMPGDTPVYVTASLAYHGLWIAYLFRSKRVRATYQ